MHPRTTAIAMSLLFLGACDDGGVEPPEDAGTQQPTDAGNAAATCPALTGAEVTHSNDITTAETWAGDGTVHRVTFGFTVRPGGSLMLAPCAVVKVNASWQLTWTGTAAQPAKLVSQGTAQRPVLITHAVAGQKWGGLRSLDGNAIFELSHTTIEGAGQGAIYGSALNLRGGGSTSTDAIPVLKADHLVLKDSAGTGLYMESGAAFTADSTELTITGGGPAPNGGYAIELNPIAAGTLPKLTVSGNAQDAIRVSAGSLYISRDLTLKNVGVPYYFYFDRVRITAPNAGTTPTLTIEPGVELRFDDYLVVGYVNVGIMVNEPGRLIAVGTPSQPIVFTSSKAARAAGDWPGIFLFNSPGSRLEHVRIEYAGGPNGISSANCKPTGSNDNAALFIGSKDYPNIPAASDFANITVASSASHGINSMWQAASFGPDLTAGFTFDSIAGCRQTRNGTPTGCGATPACMVP